MSWSPSKQLACAKNAVKPPKILIGVFRSGIHSIAVISKNGRQEWSSYVCKVAGY